MRWRHTAAGESARVVRLAWLASFLATLALVAILAMAKSAQALTVAYPGGAGALAATTSPPDLEAEEEGEEDEFEAEECEEGEGEACEEEGAGPEAPSECVLGSAQATVFASPVQDKVRLVVRYTAVSPTVVAVDYGLHGSKGSLYLGQSRKRFSRAGTFRQTETLSEAQMAKVAGAKDFTVQLYAVDAPDYCRHYFDRHLTARHAAPSGLIWADPEASFRR
jgi:hypothetical protein